jgi:hypothetical protein
MNIDFFNKPRTIKDAVDHGITRDMVYNNVKKGTLINLKRKDAWGRTIKGNGLFIVPNATSTEISTELFKVWQYES